MIRGAPCRGTVRKQRGEIKMPRAWNTVAMVPVFLRDAATLLSEEELFELVTYLSLNPEAGVVIPATG
jgi:hypothetical protein